MRGRLLLLALLLATGAAGLVATGMIRVPWNLSTPEPVAIVVTPSEDSSHSEQEPSSHSEQNAGKSAIEEAQAALGLGTDTDDSKANTDDSKDEKDSPALTEPVLDIARISPDGTSVFAGRAAPNSYVTIFEDGKKAGTTRADEHGSWSLATEHRFANLDPKLSLRADDDPPAPETPSQPTEPQQRQEALARSEATHPESAPASPSAQVMKTFEDIVAKAREKHARAVAQAEDAQKETPEPTAGPDTATSDDANAEKSESEQTQSEESTSVAPAPTPAAAETAAEAVMSAEHSAPGIGAAEPMEPAEPPTNADPRAGVTVDTPSNRTPSAATGQASIPVPIMFVYNEATFTPEGERAVALLLEYVTLEKLPSIHLSGHADERGTDAYNMDLSRERLEAVARVLRDGGYTGKLELTPKGKREPFMGVDRSKYSREALYQLDRRVELHITR